MKGKLLVDGIKDYARSLMDIIDLYILSILQSNDKLPKQVKEYNIENKEEESDPTSKN